VRAVIDTNVWVSAVLNPHGAPAQVFEAFRQARFLAIQSQPLMDELREVMARPRLMRRLAYNMQMIQELIELISARAIWVEVRGEVSVCRDPHDNTNRAGGVYNCPPPAGSPRFARGTAHGFGSPCEQGEP
jgi:putative PIN family toxin of toxin-antitoxin system